MKLKTFSVRTAKEILRDPLNLAFGLGFPLVLLVLLTAIQRNIPVSLFELNSLTPGVAVFGLSFMTLFSATLISRDRSSSLLQRLYTTPLRPADYILGYTLPILPIALAQGAVCFVLALLLGLEPTANILLCLAGLIPVSVFFIAVGLLCGSIFTDKQVGGICGALLTNLSAWLSGTWFDIELVGGAFKKIAYALPYVHAVELERSLLAGDSSGILPHLTWVLAYGAGMLIISVLVFRRKMKRV